MHLQAKPRTTKDCWRYRQPGERHGTDLLLEPSEGVWLCQCLDFRLLAATVWENKPLSLKPPCLWYLVMGPLGINTNNTCPVFLRGNGMCESFVSLKVIGHFSFTRKQKTIQADRLKRGNLLTREADESRQKILTLAQLSRLFHLSLRISMVAACSSRHVSSQINIQVKRKGAFLVASKEVKLIHINSSHVSIS